VSRPSDEFDPGHVLLPVLPLKEICLFPEASLGAVVARPAAIRALEIALRSGRRVISVSHRDTGAVSPSPRDLQSVGTIADIVEDHALPDGSHQIELDGALRAKLHTLVGIDTLVAEVEPLPEEDAGGEWGPAVEALARYLHTHADLRRFLEQQRRSREPMGWVNLACQHLPITASARQKLLEATSRERCAKISRGLDALLRKESTT
jgi:ATP-dependent Lon protease